jgi:hypothetical protein
VRRPFIIGWFVIVASLLSYGIIQHWLLVGVALADFVTFLQAVCHSAVPSAHELAL